jgi:hypothetical protein
MALLTAAQARVYIPGITSAEDTNLDAIILRVGAAIARYLGYPAASAGVSPTIESTTYTLYSGAGELGVVVSQDGTALLTAPRPITAITSIHDDPDQGYGASYLVASTDYTYDALDGVVRLLPTATHGAFSSAPYAVKLVVVAGYATVPADIIEAAALTVAHRWRQKKQPGASENAPEADGVGIPPAARALLAPYRIALGWVA